MNTQAAQVYFGDVMHQRFFPMQYRFKYQMISLKIDIDQIEEVANDSRWFSLNRFNLFSLRFEDFGARQPRHWRSWVNGLLRHYGIQQAPHRVELVCFPRFLGMGFNPLAMWYAYNADNELIAIIGETSNTFNQWHHYVLTNQGNPLETPIKASAKKAFHVSPFLGMACHYHFRFYKPGSQFKLHISQTENHQPVLLATQVAKAAPMTNNNLLKAAFKQPFASIKALFLIHWWAIKIWRKGGKFHKTPAHLQHVTASHTEMKSC